MSLLFARYPQLTSRLPWVRLCAGPTPVERAPGLGEGVWVKRDDQTARPYGGNKVRKLELLLAAAQRRGKRAVLTLGGTGSNHVLATAIYARALGFRATHAVLFAQPNSPEVSRKRQAFAELAVGATRVPAKPFVPLAVLARAFSSVVSGDGVPELIGPGGSSPLGALGYVAAAFELQEQIAAGDCSPFRTIFVPLGSGGTAAGLLLGLRLAGLDARLAAVRVVPRPWVSGAGVARLATRAAELLVELGVELPPGARSFRAGDLDVVDDQLGPGYGVATPAAEAAVALGADAGLVLDTTYSGKTLAALRARRGPGPTLFWLTYASFKGDS